MDVLLEYVNISFSFSIHVLGVGYLTIVTPELVKVRRTLCHTRRHRQISIRSVWTSFACQICTRP